MHVILMEENFILTRSNGQTHGRFAAGKKRNKSDRGHSENRPHTLHRVEIESGGFAPHLIRKLHQSLQWKQT